MKKAILITLLINLAFAFFANAQKTYSITFNPTNGSKFKLTTSQNALIIQDFEGMEMKMQMNIDIHATQRYGKEGTTQKMTFSYDSLKLGIVVMGNEIKLSSTEEAKEETSSNEALNAMKAMIGKEIAITMDPKGKVIDIDGTDKIFKDQSNAELKKIMTEQMGDDALKALVEQSFGFYPKQPVKLGDSWTNDIRLKNTFPLSGSLIYTLVKAEGKKGVLSVNGTITADTTSTINNLKALLDLSGNIIGQIEIDLETGLPILAEMEQKLRGNIEVQSQKIPMAASIQIKMVYSTL